MTSVRRQLNTLTTVTTSLVLVAFLVPLGLVLRASAESRAVAAATDAAQTTAAFVALDPASAATVASMAGDGPRVSVFLADGTVTGVPAARTESVELAARGRAFTAARDGGIEVLVPVQGIAGGTAVVRAFAPAAQLHAGVIRQWLALALLGVALLAIAIALADRLGRRLVGAVTGLAATADRLAAGDLDARVTPDGPREIRTVGAELNRLAGRIGELLHAEREEVADLAHRLRTPVAALRLDVDSVADERQRERLSDDVDDLTRVVDEVIRTARRTVRDGLGAVADLAEAARARVDFWTPLAEDGGRGLELSVPAGPVPVRGPAEDLTAALDALLQNVFAHTPEGTDATVTVTGRAGGGGTLTVADAGPGFAPGTTPTARGVSGADSTGLGLDIARRTAEASGGAMAIARSPRGGAEVTLTFGPPA